VDNFWSCDDIRVHTFGVRPRPWSPRWGTCSRASRPAPHGAKRRGAEAARQPISAGDLQSA